MTTILAVKNPPTIYSDSRCNDRDRETNNFERKILKMHLPWNNDSVLKKYYGTEGMTILVGYAGYVEAGEEVFCWCEQGMPMKERPSFDRENSCDVVIVTPAQQIFYLQSRLIPHEVKEPYYGEGSGRTYLYGALKAYETIDMNLGSKGADVYRWSMEIAAELDMYSGLPIQKLTL